MRVRYVTWPDLFVCANDGDHVVLPLDPARIDDAVVESMAKAIRKEQGCVGPWREASEVDQQTWIGEARVALSALLTHFAKVSHGA